MSMTQKMLLTIAGLVLGAISTVYAAHPDAPFMAYLAGAAAPVGAYLVGLFQSGPWDPKNLSMPPLVKAMLILPLVAALAGCATLGAGAGGPAAPKTGDVLDALDKLADNPLVNFALADADKTNAWVDAQVAKGMDPAKAELARACPRAVKFAAADLKAKIAALKAQLAGGPIPDIADPTGAIYALTVLKYGGALDPKAELAQLRADIGLRMDALFTGCVHLFPKKQVNDVAILLGKAGIASQLGPLAGLLP
jgi:hypothetical protein